MLAKSMANLSPEERVVVRDQMLAEKYGTGSPDEPVVMASDGGGMEPPAPPEVVPAVPDPDPADFARRVVENLDAMRNGDMDLQEAMSSDVRRFVSTTGNTTYVPHTSEEMIAGNRALHDMLHEVIGGRAAATGIDSVNMQEITQQAVRLLNREQLSTDLLTQRFWAARAGDPRSQDDLVYHTALLLRRDDTVKYNSIAAIEFQNNTDEAVKADAMRRLWAGYEDQMKLDVAHMTATRKDGQRLRMAQGPERVVYTNAQELPGGTILRHGTEPDAGEAILKSGFESSAKYNLMGEGVYFTTSPRYSGGYGPVEVFGDLPSDIRILDLFAMDKPINQFVRDIGLGKVGKSGQLTAAQKKGIREWADKNGYQGIRFNAEFDKAAKGVDEVLIFDVNAANRVVGSEAAVQPIPDLPDETVQQIAEREMADPANSLMDKLDPEIRADIENGVLGPDAEAVTDLLARAVIASRDTKGFGPHFANQMKPVPTGRLVQDFILQAYRNSLLASVRTMTRMLLGGSYRTMTLGAIQAIDALKEAGVAGLGGNGKAAAHALRRAGLDMGIYLRMMIELPHALKLAGHSLKEGESFGNLGRSQSEIGQRGFTEADQMALQSPAFVEEMSSRTTLNNPFFLDPENKNMTAKAMRTVWQVWSLSGRVSGSLDTFFSSLVGPSAEWARHMDLQLRQAEDLGMEPLKAWKWASDKTEELLDAQWAKVVTEGGNVIERGALTGQHAQVVMDWANFTDPLDVKFQDRSYEYGIRVAKDEGLTDPAEIAQRAMEWVNEVPSLGQRMGMKLGRTAGWVPKIYQDAINNNPVVGMLQGFNRGPANIVKAVARSTGFLNPLVDTYWRDINSEDVMTRNRAQGEIAMGWLTAVTAATLTTSGYVQLSGPGSLNPEVRQKMRNEGYRQFAIRFRNPWTNEWSAWWDLSALDPMASIFAGVATYMDSANNMSTENREALAGNLILATAHAVGQVGVGPFTKGMYAGVMEMADMLQDFGSGAGMPMQGKIGAFDAWVQKKMTGFMPATFRNIRRGMDPYERVIPPGDWPYPFSGVQELGYRFMNELPGLSQNLPPRLHPITASPNTVDQVWGTEFIPPEQPWLRGLVQGLSPTSAMPYTTGSVDPVDNELARLSGRGTAFIVWNANEFQIPNYRLDIYKLNRLAEITRDYVPPGRTTTLHGELTNLITSAEYQALPEATPSRATESARAIQINKVINYYKGYIKEEFRAQDPEVNERLTRIEKQKLMNQNEAGTSIEDWTRRYTR